MDKTTTSNLDLITLDILAKVEGFYFSAFSILMVFITIMFVVLGIVIPYLLSRQQKKDFEKLLKQTKEYFDEEMTDRETALNVQINERLSTILKDQKEIIKEEAKKANAMMEGATNYILGSNHYTESKYVLSLVHLLCSAGGYIEAEDLSNSKISIEYAELALSQCNDAQYSEHATLTATLTKNFEILKNLLSDSKYADKSILVSFNKLQDTWKSHGYKEENS